MEKLIELAKSRKFWAAVVAVIFIVVKAYKPDIPVSEQQVTDLVTILAAYIIGTGLETKAF